MSNAIDFGTLDTSAPEAPDPRVPRHLLLLGDFSGQGRTRPPRSGEELARLKPLRLDVDGLDGVLAALGATLSLPGGLDAGAEAVELAPRSLDDLHPDALCEEVPAFAELDALARQLSSPRGAAAALPALRRLGIDLASAAPSVSQLAGPGQACTPAARVERLARAAASPFAQPAAAPEAALLRAALDGRRTQWLRELLRQPGLRQLEAAWRGLDFFVRRVDTGPRLQCLLLDVGDDEFAADLRTATALEDTALYRWLVERPRTDARHGVPYAVIAHQSFALTASDTQLLGRAARIAAQARVPFIAGWAGEALPPRPQDLDVDTAQAWAALRALPQANHLALLAPRFLLRMPYGARNEPLDGFGFEELEHAAEAAQALPWGHPALLAGVLLARHLLREGAGKPPRELLLQDLPCGLAPDEDGELVALPGTQWLLDERQGVRLQALGLTPVFAARGRPQLRLGGFMAVNGQALAGSWGDVPASVAVPREAGRATACAEPETPATGGAERADAMAVGMDADLASALAGLDANADAAPAEADALSTDDLDALLRDL
jgi:type VI secretion system protein ImpC